MVTKQTLNPVLGAREPLHMPLTPVIARGLLITASTFVLLLSAVKFDAISSQQEVEPSPDQWITGFVVDINDNPIENVLVQLNAIQGAGIVQAKINVKTDTDGIWRWNCSTIPGVTSLRIEHPDYKTQAIDILGKDRFETRLEPAGALRGCVIDDANLPVANTVVSLHTAEVRREGPIPISARPIGNEMQSAHVTTTDPNGNFSFRGIQTSVTNVRVIHPDGHSATMDNVETADPGVLSIRLSKPRSIQLKVIDELNRPIENAKVGVVSWEHSSALDWRKLTDSMGTVDWPNAPKGELVFLIDHVEWCCAYFVSDFNKSITKTITLTKPHEISGFVVDSESKEPIHGFRLDWDYSRISPRLADRERYPDANGIPSLPKLPLSKDRTVIGRNGDFSITSNLAFDRLTLKIKAEGYDPLQIPPIGPQGEMLTRRYELVRRPIQSIQICRPSGVTAERCNYALVSPHSEIDLDNLSITTVNQESVFSTEITDASGRLSLSGELERTLVVWNDSGFFAGPVGEVAISEKVQLVPWTQITISDSRSNAEQDADPVSITTQTNEHIGWKSIGSTNTSVGWSFKLPQGNNSGSTIVSTTTTPSHTLRIMLKPGENTTLNLFGNCSVKGKVQIKNLPETKDFNSALSIKLSRVAGSSFHEFYGILRNGDFRFDRIPPGSYSLTVVREEKRGPNDPPKMTLINLEQKILVGNEREIDLGDVALAYQTPSPSGKLKKQPKTTNEIRFEATTSTVNGEKRGKFLTLSIDTQGVAGPLRILDDAAQTLRSWESHEIEWENYGVDQGGVAFDLTRERIYIAKRNGIAVLSYGGQLLGNISGRFGAKIAVDVKGNIWAFESVDQGWYRKLFILSPDLTEQLRIDVNARDLCFSAKDNSTWLAGEKVMQVSSDGKILAQIDLPIKNVSQPISMITPDWKWGGCAVVEWSNILGASNCRIHRINSEATKVVTTEIGSLIPISMAIANGDVWLSAIEMGGSNPTTFRVDREGKIVERSPVSRISLRIDQNNQSVWATEKHRFLRLSAESGTIQVVESIPRPDNGTAFLWTY